MKVSYNQRDCRKAEHAFCWQSCLVSAISTIRSSVSCGSAAVSTSSKVTQRLGMPHACFLHVLTVTAIVSVVSKRLLLNSTFSYIFYIGSASSMIELANCVSNKIYILFFFFFCIPIADNVLCFIKYILEHYQQLICLLETQMCRQLIYLNCF